MKKLLLLLFIICGFFQISAQSYLGTWTSYLPYNSASRLAIVGEKVFCSTEGGLFYYNESDNSLNKFSKEDGLSDSEISTIAYSKTTDILLIAYKNANLDLISNNIIYNLQDIKRKQILGDKNIYEIFFLNDKAYLACGFGIVVIDLNKKEIKETYYIGDNGEQIKINSISSDQTYIYAGTDKGLYFADLNSPNLIDYNNWKKDAKLGGPEYKINSMTFGNNSLYISFKNANFENDSIYQKVEESWLSYPWFQNKRIQSLNYSLNRLLICSQYEIDVFSNSGELIKHSFTGNPQYAEYANEDVIYLADKDAGLFKLSNNWEKTVLIPEGPAGNSINDLDSKDGKLISVAGGTTSSWNNLYKNAEFYLFDDNNWENWKNDSIKDLINVKFDPFDKNRFFASSWGYGLLEFQNNELKEVYRNQNSTLESILPGYFFRLGGMDFDSQGNLWVSNGGVSKPLSVLKKDNTWKSFAVSSVVGTKNMAGIIVTEDNNKWIILLGGNGLFVFNDNNTIDNEDDDESLILSVVDKNGSVISNEIFSIAEDRDGNIWLGTNQGPLVYYSPNRVFTEENFYAQQIIIPRNDGSGLGDPLLGTESITCIEVDGANRKWLGTAGGGLYLVSEDGLDQILEFNTSNSPLLSNSITSIEIIDETGEVFIGTEAGLISFIGDATQPNDVYNDVYVYPNPVRESYQGNVVVSGLIEDSFVKFTDINGNLVYETKSLGGQAIWDGKNFNGDRVASGVYLVFCTIQDGSQTFVTKLLFIH